MTPRPLRRALLSICTSLCAACAGTAPYQTGSEQLPQLQAEVQTLARETEALLRKQDELVWKTWTEGTPVDIASTYEGKAPLFSPDAIRKVEALRAATAEPREQRALTNLKTYLAGEHLASKLAEVSDALANLESTVTFNVEGVEYPYRDLDRLLANERSATRRRALHDSALAAIDRLAPSLKRKGELLDQTLKELGYPSYEAFGRELRQTDLDALAGLAGRILDSTQALYQTVMGRLSQRELELPFDKLHRADIPRLFRPRGVDSYFPKDQLLPRVTATLAGLGLNLVAMKNVTLDLSESPRKNPRGITLPVVVPTDIRVSVRPAQGIDAQASFLHEAGHALHDGLTQERRFELAKLGNIAVPETFGLLFEDLLTDPVWLEEQARLTGEPRASYLAASAAHRLYLLRRTAGRLLFQVELHRQPSKDPAALYSAVMARTYLLPVSPEEAARSWVEQDDFYAAADTFRSWFLAAQLEAHLKGKFGAAWWKQKEAGKLLQALWSPGNAVGPEELARQWGDAGLKPDALLLRLQTALGASGTPEPQRSSAPMSGAPVRGAPSASTSMSTP